MGNLAISKLILDSPDFTDFSKCQNRFLTNVLTIREISEIRGIEY